MYNNVFFHYWKWCILSEFRIQKFVIKIQCGPKQERRHFKRPWRVRLLGSCGRTPAYEMTLAPATLHYYANRLNWFTWIIPVRGEIMIYGDLTCYKCWKWCPSLSTQWWQRCRKFWNTFWNSMWCEMPSLFIWSVLYLQHLEGLIKLSFT